MKEMNGKIQYKGKEYGLAFNLNVMELIQEEYGTLEKWGELTDDKKARKDEDGQLILDDNGEPIFDDVEPNAKAIKFGFMVMLNEAIDIENDEHGTNIKPLTLSQVGRMLTEVGLGDATSAINETVIASVGEKEKNA